MSKSMAIEGVMKIFLMVAVIIVGMSFLLKAFGIDIIGWLEEKFSGLGVPDKGKVIYIKTDPEDSPIEVWEFFIGDGFSSKGWPKFFGESSSNDVVQAEYDRFFSVSNLPLGKCVIFTTDERGQDKSDLGMIYEVAPGAVIGRSCDGKTLENCIGTSIDNRYCRWVTRNGGEDVKCVERNCVLEGSWENGVGVVATGSQDNYVCHDYRNLIECDGFPGPGSLTALGNRCATGEGVFKKGKFGSGNLHDTCWKDNPKKCNLLGESKEVLEDLKKSQKYVVKFGVVCGGDGEWYVCKEDNKIPSGVKDCRCEGDGDMFYWEGSCLPAALDFITLVEPKNNDVTGGGAILKWKSIPIAKAYKYSVERLVPGGSPQVVVAPACSLAPQPQGELVQGSVSVNLGNTYSWYAQACLDASCTKCGNPATKIEFRTEHEATESITGWNRDLCTISGDRTIKKIGDLSIKCKRTGVGDMSMFYPFTSPISIGNSVNFFAKSGFSFNLNVVLHDNTLKKASKTITIDPGTVFQDQPISLSKAQFDAEANFDWGNLALIEFKVLVDDIWVDGLHIK